MARPFGELVQEIEDDVLHNPEDDMRPRIRRWLNRSQREILSDRTWDMAEVEKTTPSTLDAPALYTFDEDFEKLIDVRIRDDQNNIGAPLPVDNIRRRDLLVPDQTGTGSSATAATVTGGNLLLTPAFDNPDHLIIARYYRAAPQMVRDDDLPLIPTNFSNVLLDGALIVGARWLWDDKGNWDRLVASFQNGLKKMLRKEKGDLTHQDQLRVTNTMDRLIRASGAGAG